MVRIWLLQYFICWNAKYCRSRVIELFCVCFYFFVFCPLSFVNDIVSCLPNQKRLHARTNCILYSDCPKVIEISAHIHNTETFLVIKRHRRDATNGLVFKFYREILYLIPKKENNLLQLIEFCVSFSQLFVISNRIEGSSSNICSYRQFLCCLICCQKKLWSRFVATKKNVLHHNWHYKSHSESNHTNISQWFSKSIGLCIAMQILCIFIHHNDAK